LDQETNAQVIAPSVDNIYGCQILEKPKSLNAEKFIWILKRGTCTYGKKAKNSQFSGALAVIVVHDDINADIENLIPYADSHFHKLQTPILLMGQADGEIILNALSSGYAQIIVSVSIEMDGKQTENATAEFWVNPASVESYDLLTKFGPIISEFGKFVQFEPKYKFENLRRKKHKKTFLKKHCYVDGHFCSVGFENFEPHSVLDEAIRQICLWRNDLDPKKLSFWRYISNYRNCLHNFEFDHKGVLDCYQMASKEAEISSSLRRSVSTCYENSFEDYQNKESSQNNLLFSQKNSYIYSDIYLVPAFIINGELLKEELSDHSILRALCDELSDPPSVCDRYVFRGRRIKNFYHVKESMTHLLVFCIFGTIFLVVFVLFWGRRMLNKRVDRELFVEVNQHVTNYMKISN
jgi:hypothetical protein